jgi:hypothetical protein
MVLEFVAVIFSPLALTLLSFPLSTIAAGRGHERPRKWRPALLQQIGVARRLITWPATELQLRAS